MSAEALAGRVIHVPAKLTMGSTWSVTVPKADIRRKPDPAAIPGPAVFGKPLRVLALDPATHCGFAHSCGASGCWDLSVRKDESGGMKLIRLQGKLNEMLRSVGVDLVVFEAQRGGNPALMGSLVVQAEIQGVLKFWCEQNKIEYRGLSPTEIKKHATGKGNAKKTAMCAAAKAKWPAKFPGPAEKINDNEADALWILDLSLASL
jgi:Holliday junction resolvasome RuvABC endonuclease subunit